MSTFVDTSALYAILDANDRHHAVAGAAWTGLVNAGEDLVTSSYVVVETCALVQRRLGITAVRVLVESLIPPLRVVWVDEALHLAGVSCVLASSGRGPSLVDCVSFAAMRRHAIHAAFAFDPHFSAQGFACTP